MLVGTDEFQIKWFRIKAQVTEMKKEVAKKRRIKQVLGP